MFETDSDMGIYDMPSWILDFDPKTELRDLKINLITSNDIKFTVSSVNMDVHENELSFIKSVCPNDVITGSFALNLYGLVNRYCNDIDILIKDKDRYTYYYNDHSYSDDVDLSNRLGYLNHSYRKEISINNKFIDNLLFPFTLVINEIIKLFGKKYNYKVDYFIDTDVRYNTFDYKGHTYKIHCPIQIIEQKIDMYLKNTNHYLKNTNHYLSRDNKHKKDLFCIFKNINFQKLNKTQINLLL